MKWSNLILNSVAVSILCVSHQVFSEIKKLPALGLNLEKTSASGLSSGAFMTSQFYIANSDIMVGAGIIAGGPYLCAESYGFQLPAVNAMTACMNPLTKSVGPNTPLLIDKTKQLSKSNLIDNIENIKDDRIYIFSGKADHVVTTMVVDQTEKFFLELGVTPNNIKYNHTVDAGHSIITNNKRDNECDVTKAPYINDCNFEQSQRILDHIYGGIKPAVSKTRGTIIEFDQTEFIDSQYTSMSKTGFAYVPDQCNYKSCKLHVVFHGCMQGAAVIHDQYYATTGYNEVADSNDMVMLYPQVYPSKMNPTNPYGCWDFWGYSVPKSTKPDFYSKNAPQIKAVSAMIKRLAENNRVEKKQGLASY